MSKISFEYNDKDYTLEFDRDTVRKTEQMGFVASKAGDMPGTMFPILFKGAFLKHHKKISNKLVEEMFDVMADGWELMEQLLNMYSEALNSMLDDDEKRKNVKWTLS